MDQFLSSDNEVPSQTNQPGPQISSSDDSSSNEDTEKQLDTIDDIDWSTKNTNASANITSSKIPKISTKKTNRLYPVCNTRLLLQKLAELKLKTNNLSWNETLTIVCNKNSSKKHAQIQMNDDIQREIHFYELTLDGVKHALTHKMTEIEYQANCASTAAIKERPNDFYAEMLKSDLQMKRIKGRILWEKKKIAIVEQRKKKKRLRKFHKSLMAEKQRTQHSQIKLEQLQINEWKKNFSTDKVDGEVRDQTLQEILKNNRKNNLFFNSSANAKVRGSQRVNMKRVMKNLKYGSGFIHKSLKGKKNKNRNTFASTNSYEGDWRRSVGRDRSFNSKGDFGKYKQDFKKKKNYRIYGQVGGRKPLRKRGVKRPSKSARKRQAYSKQKK